MSADKLPDAPARRTPASLWIAGGFVLFAAVIFWPIPQSERPVTGEDEDGKTVAIASPAAPAARTGGGVSFARDPGDRLRPAVTQRRGGGTTSVAAKIGGWLSDLLPTDPPADATERETVRTKFNAYLIAHLSDEDRRRWEAAEAAIDGGEDPVAVAERLADGAANEVLREKALEGAFEAAVETGRLDDAARVGRRLFATYSADAERAERVVPVADAVAAADGPEAAVAWLKDVPVRRLDGTEGKWEGASTMVLSRRRSEALLKLGRAEEAVQAYMSSSPVEGAGHDAKERFLIESLNALVGRVGDEDPALGARFALHALRRFPEEATPGFLAAATKAARRDESNPEVLDALREMLLTNHPQTRQAGDVAFDAARDAKDAGNDAEAAKLFRAVWDNPMARGREDAYLELFELGQEPDRSAAPTPGPTPDPRFAPGAEDAGDAEDGV